MYKQRNNINITHCPSVAGYALGGFFYKAEGRRKQLDGLRFVSLLLPLLISTGNYPVPTFF